MQVIPLTKTKTPSPNEVAKNPILFAKTFLKIQDSTMQTIPLNYNYFQRDYLSKRTARDLIVKPRQLGFSTAIQGECRRYEWTRATRSLTLGKDDENTADLRAIADFFYEHLPDKFRPMRTINNATRSVYPEIGSRATIRTAGNRNSGRGGTNNVIHLSEVAFYPDAQKLIASALQAGNPFWVVAESTTNGAQGWFYDEVQAALRGESVWTVHFYRWFDNPAYALPLLPKERFVYDEEEKFLVKTYHLSPEQIKWRRNKRLELRDLFYQEYPEDIKTCFLQGGGNVFNMPLSQFYDILETVAIDGHVYVAGLDWGEENDFTVLSIFDITDYREVALLRINRMSYYEMCQELVKLLQIWHVEKVIVERNAMGKAAAEHLQNAINNTEWKIDTRFNLPAEPILEMFFMNNQRKVDLVSQFHTGISEGLRLLNHPIANAELGMFTRKQTPNNSWSYEASSGHDDTVIARMLANKACYELR